MGDRFIVAAAALVTATPAWAQAGTAVPEASSAMLFALGVLGVIVGRRASHRRSRGDAEQD